MMLSAFVPESERNNTFGEMKCLPPHGKCYMFAHEKYDHDGAIEFCDKYGEICLCGTLTNLCKLFIHIHVGYRSSTDTECLLFDRICPGTAQN
ncbi:hypothetical protein AHF37_00424 [Paragonimus kellicotti]|nr:hypothetical protein AHF37_00424 [Paragonimus kellicotti]